MNNHIKDKLNHPVFEYIENYNIKKNRIKKETARENNETAFQTLLNTKNNVRKFHNGFILAEQNQRFFNYAYIHDSKKDNERMLLQAYKNFYGYQIYKYDGTLVGKIKINYKTMEFLLEEESIDTFYINLSDVKRQDNKTNEAYFIYHNGNKNCKEKLRDRVKNCKWHEICLLFCLNKIELTHLTDYTTSNMGHNFYNLDYKIVHPMMTDDVLMNISVMDFYQCEVMYKYPLSIIVVFFLGIAIFETKRQMW